MMRDRDMTLITIISLLKEEAQCLRSVLSEFDGDKQEFVQMNRANMLKDARETLEFKI